VLGAGVTASEAATTARRMGALVTCSDLRSVGREESPARQAGSAEWIGGFDIVITTAHTPGRTPPVLVSEDAVHRMRPGSVIVDLAAGPLGGNVEGAEADTTVVLAPGVVVIGAANLPAAMAPAASAAYARNITALLAHLARDGRVALDLTDEIQAAVLVTHQGTVVNPGVARLLEPKPVAGRTS
jgi:NAD(P) transhydrogenase subunit alpha